MTATQEVVAGSICGPVRIEIEGFPPIFDEVLVDVTCNPRDGHDEPLIGYITRLENLGPHEESLESTIMKLCRDPRI